MLCEAFLPYLKLFVSNFYYDYLRNIVLRTWHAGERYSLRNVTRESWKRHRAFLKWFNHLVVNSGPVVWALWKSVGGLCGPKHWRYVCI